MNFSFWHANIGIALLFYLLLPILSKELKVFKRGKVELIDETQLQWPNDYAQDFEEDVRKSADFGDVYDEQLAPLPRYEVYKSGKYLGWTQPPMVTRKKAWWSTPLPRSQPWENPPWTYTTQRPKIVTRPSAPKKEENPIAAKATMPPAIINLEPKKSEVNAPENVPIPSSSTVASTKQMPISSKKVATTASVLLETSTTKSVQFPTKGMKAEKANAENANMLERLRKKLLALRPRPPQRTEVAVKSNSFAIQPLPSPKPQSTTKAPFTVTAPPMGVPGQFAWSRSWSIGPDGRMEIRTWDSKHGERVEHRQLASSEVRRLLSAGLQSSSPLPPTTTTPERSSESDAAKVSTQNRKPFKPSFIQSNVHRHKGPTFDCRVLDAAVDGQPSEANDPSCPLDFPGIPSDGTCKCTYQVSAKDEQGCATGFIYTCTRKVPLAQPTAETEEPFAAAAARQLQLQ